MNISETFIRRPVATSLLVLGLLVFGILGYQALPVNALPDVDFPTISVSASLPGALPQVMASTVATPLEQQFSSIAGITSMTSTSSTGQTSIVLQFDLNENINTAAQDVQTAIAAAVRHLPQEMSSPPTYKKVNPADAPILYLALSSKTLPLSFIDKYAETILAQRISMVSGVAQVNIYGSQKYAVRIEANPELLAGYQLSLKDIAAAVSQGNASLPTGTLNGQRQSIGINNINGQLEDAAAFGNLIVAYKNGSPVELKQLGQVIDSVQNNLTATWYNQQRAIVLAIQRQPGTNTIAVIDGIKKLLPAFKAELPKAIKLDTVYDRSISIRESIKEVQMTLLIAAVLVVFVIFIFLRNFSSTLIPAAALPLSLIGTFAFMAYFGFSLNNISLLALTLIVGYVIDDAIVMLENISRHIEMGKKPFDAALAGSKEIGFTILSMTLSLGAVFIPILFMSGLIGRLFHEFAVTSVTAILISGVISLTLTPMLASRFLKPHKALQTGNFYLKLYKKYDQTLQWSLTHPRQILGVFFLSLILCILFFIVVPKGFMRAEDIGQLTGFTEADNDVSFAEMVKRQQKAADIIQQNPDVAGVVSSVGAGGARNTINLGRLFLHLKPLDERKYSASELIPILRSALTGIPGLSVFFQMPSAIPIGGRQTKSTYQYTLQDSDQHQLRHWTEKFQTALRQLPELEDVTSDLENIAPQLDIRINRAKAAALGVSVADIQNTLGYAYGSEQVSSIYTPLDEYEVILGLSPVFQKNPQALESLYVPNNTGQQIPLSTLASITSSFAPMTVNHEMQFPSSTISFNVKPNVSLGEAVSLVEKIKEKLNPPMTLMTSFAGTAQAFQASLHSMGLLLILAILVIYIILGILYESFIHPLTILSGLPVAAVGALLVLIVCHSELDLYSFIGIIMLIGIVKKNAIMMIDFAVEAQRTENQSAEQAIYTACLTRFRPIMMTTMAAILGALPIALAMGAGAESRRPLGIAVVGGLLFSQFLTLYITPVIYIYLENLKNKKIKK